MMLCFTDVAMGKVPDGGGFGTATGLGEGETWPRAVAAIIAAAIDGEWTRISRRMIMDGRRSWNYRLLVRRYTNLILRDDIHLIKPSRG